MVVSNTSITRHSAIICVIIINVVLLVASVFTSCSIKDIEQGVVINGVCWATRNVNAPCSFTTYPESAGMFYQFNSKVGWSSVNPVVNSNGGKQWGDDSIMDNIMWGEKWLADNDPSPDGWRVPTSEELKSLLDTLKVSNKWVTQNSTHGITFTDKTTGNSIFLPANGARNNEDGVLFGFGDLGGYWSSVTTTDNSEYADVLQFFAEWTSDAEFAKQFGENNPSCSNNKRDMGFSIRCVKQ
jgi:uncharacterized protein (TIGR02145 family)